jgi:hypothetical protein
VIVALALLLQIAGAPAQDTSRDTPAVVRRVLPTPGAEVSFRSLIAPETVYVGQQATYQLGVFVDERVRDRLRRMEAMAPEMRGMLAYDPDPQRGSYNVRFAGRRYEVHVYQRAVFPLTAGTHIVPSARLVYAVPLSFSFFSREESFELRSDSATVVAIEPPLAGRPPEYTGAVGSLRIETRIDTGARVGVPLELSVRLTGQGNVKLFPRPVVSVPWASAVPAGEKVRLDGGLLSIRGTKEFSWVVTPQRAGRVVLPPVRYAFFDPVAEQYGVTESVPETLTVEPGALAGIDARGSATRPRWSLRTSYRGELSDPLYSRRPFWLGLALVPVQALTILAARRPRRTRRRKTAAVQLRAMARGGSSHSAVSDVRRTYLRAVGDRLRTSPTAIADPTAFERAARRAGVSLRTAAEGAALLAELDGASFGPDAHAVRDAATRAQRLFRSIDREARSFEGAPRALTMLLVATLVGGSASVLAAGIPSDELARFQRGVSAYEQGRFHESAREFAALAVQAPRAADAWANLGTAAWAATDTARAAVGWQRALRLEPLANDARDRLSLLGVGDSPGIVPRLPPSAIALVAAALWVAVWIAAALRVRQRRPVSTLVTAVAGAAILLGLSAGAIDRQLAARDLAVLERGTPLRVLPALGAEPEGSGHTGEVARILERRAEWSRVSLGGRQEGWVETALLISLARD